MIVLDDGTWKVAPQAAKFRYREAGDVSEDEEDPEKIDELADDESDKADDECDKADDECDKADDESDKADDSGKNKKAADLGEDAEEKDDELEKDEEEIDELEEDSVLETEVADQKTESSKVATKDDAKVKNVLLARKSDSNAAISTITSEKSDTVESKSEGKAKVEEKGKVSN